MRVLPWSDDGPVEFLDDAALGMKWIGTDGRIRWANRAEQELLGYDEAELVGCHVAEFHVDRDVVDRVLRRAAGGETVRNVRARVRRRDGGVRVVLMSCDPYWRDGEPAGTRCFMQDLTDLRPGDLGGDDGEAAAAAAALSALRRELEVARRIQTSILARHAPAIPGLEVAGIVRPAAQCSGDFLDYLPLPGGCLGVALGDVSGHGLGPALIAAQTSTCLRTLTRVCGGRIDHLMTEANALLHQSTPGESFVSMAIVAVDPVSNALHYVNAGHPPALLFGADGTFRAELEAGDLPLAVAPDTSYRLEGPVALRRGELVVLVSDGLLEAWSEGGDSFGRQRLRQLVSANHRLPCAELVQAVYDGVRAFSGRGPQHDDMSVVALRRLGVPL